MGISHCRVVCSVRIDDRSVAENLALFEDMRKGKFAEGEAMLRLAVKLLATSASGRKALKAGNGGEGFRRLLEKYILPLAEKDSAAELREQMASDETEESLSKLLSGQPGVRTCPRAAQVARHGQHVVLQPQQQGNLVVHLPAERADVA